MPVLPVLSAPASQLCATCGSRDHYQILRTVQGEAIAVRLCPSCDAGHPLVLAFEQALRVVLQEDGATSPAAPPLPRAEAAPGKG